MIERFYTKMNPNLAQLAHEAGITVNAESSKFAQLIVKECAKVCDLYAMPDGTSETAIILAYAIRKKFGVE